MSRRLGVLIAMVIAVVLGALVQLHEVGAGSLNDHIPALIGKSISFFIVGGLLAGIAWAIFRSRMTSFKPVLIAWIMFQLIDAAINYFSAGQQVVIGG